MPTTPGSFADYIDNVSSFGLAHARYTAAGAEPLRAQEISYDDIVFGGELSPLIDNLPFVNALHIADDTILPHKFTVKLLNTHGVMIPLGIIQRITSSDWRIIYPYSINLRSSGPRKLIYYLLGKHTYELIHDNLSIPPDIDNTDNI